MKKITAKFNSKCAETGKAIRKGEQMYYDYSAKKCYHLTSMAAQSQNTDDSLARNDRDYVNAQENAYFDNFCQQNNI